MIKYALTYLLVVGEEINGPGNEVWIVQVILAIVVPVVVVGIAACAAVLLLRRSHIKRLRAARLATLTPSPNDFSHTSTALTDDIRATAASDSTLRVN